MRRAAARVVLALLPVLGLLGPAPGCSVQPKQVLGGQCKLNSECAAPLVCRLDRCRIECATRRDCPLGSSCVLGNDGLGACLLDDELDCILASDCPEPLTCRNERCVNECEVSRDCPAENECVAAGDFARSCVPAGGERCFRNSDCEEPNVCARDGRCHPECVEDRDCARGELCLAGDGTPGACVLALSDGGVPPIDATVDGGPDAAPDATSDASDSAVTRRDGAPPFECTADAQCVAPNAVTRCDVASTRCEVIGCTAGFGDCDLEAHNGCEDDLSTPAHCGTCGIACPGPGARCAAGACENPIVQLSVGAAHGCYRREQGEVYCWGDNFAGQLGDGDVMPRERPVAVMSLTDAVDLGVGNNHSCAIRADGTVACWGYNFQGQVGNGSTTNAPIPAAVPLPADAVDVSGGYGHSCAVLDTGEAYCWGHALDGRLGDGTNAAENRLTPVRVMSDDNFTAIAAAYKYTCALREDGAVLCWGINGEGELGLETATTRTTPTDPVADIASAREIDNGHGSDPHHSCVIEADGHMRCWGRALGLGYGGGIYQRHPVSPMGIGAVRDIGVGKYASCAADARGEVFCWGRSTLLSPAPAGIDRVAHLDFGDTVVCALREDQTIWCWEPDSSGVSRFPRRVPGF